MIPAVITPEELKNITEAAKIRLQQQHNWRQEQIAKETLISIEKQYDTAIANASQNMRMAALSGHSEVVVYDHLHDDSACWIVSHRLEKEFQNQGHETKIRAYKFRGSDEAREEDRRSLIVSW